MNTASSRLRVFSLTSTLKNLGIQVNIHSAEHENILDFKTRFDELGTRDVLVVQKRVTPEILSYVDRAISNGAFIIYDIDDFGSALWWWTSPRLCYEMLLRANLITTDTIGRAKWLLQSHKRLNVQVWHNSVDYSPTEPSKLEPITRSPLRVLWFGTSSNLHMFTKYVKALGSLPDIQIVICGGSEELVNSLCPELKFEVIPWSLTNFLHILQSCDLSCLMHDGSLYDRQKSNHKMITSICWGVPAIVSDTPEYARIAREAGVDDAIFSNAEELLKALQKYRSSSSRKAYLEKAQNLIWEKYSPDKIARKFVEIVEEGIQSGNKSIYSASQNQSNTQISKISSYLSYILWRFMVEEHRLQFLQDRIKESGKNLLTKIRRFLRIKLEDMNLAGTLKSRLKTPPS
ncbi:glycosyltransferase [Nostoc sp. T09]|uniref:glycosyltransferase n=1 Tax=Nostoc sp. T09 TaxID=1932621 RepID=UPI0015C4EC23|nr:glycosyltransferase [Nostoc sp. T09]